MASKAPQYADALTKEATDLQERMAVWIVDKTGIDLDGMSPQEAFDVAVKLTVALRMIFQASPENKADTAARRAAKAAAPAKVAPAKAVETAVATGTKRRGPAKKVAAKAPAKKVAPAKRTPRRRGAAATSEAADF
jgi:hypothetical protein